MRREIREFRIGKGDEGNDQFVLAPFDVGKGGVVDDVAEYEAGEGPVVCGITEDVGYWHGIGGESVDKKRL